jgi:hypothetical protein
MRQILHSIRLHNVPIYLTTDMEYQDHSPQIALEPLLLSPF